MVTGAAPQLARAYALCARVARRHYENFPVASILVPRDLRPHIAAIYAFSRAADDVADEGSSSADERAALLQGWRERLHRAAEGDRPPLPPGPGEPPNTEAIFLALGHTIRALDLPLALFEDLISAFQQDVVVARYATWTELLDYCRRSANPIGRLVLRVARRSSPRADSWSDAVCSALQLANFWQDLKTDFVRGRIYLPIEEQARSGARENDLAGGRMTAAWRHALREATLRTRTLFDDGRPVCDVPSGRLRYELRATWLGGVRILDRIERAGFDVMSSRPALGAADAVWIARRLCSWPPPTPTNP